MTQIVTLHDELYGEFAWFNVTWDSHRGFNIREKEILVSRDLNFFASCNNFSSSYPSSYNDALLAEVRTRTERSPTHPTIQRRLRFNRRFYCTFDNGCGRLIVKHLWQRPIAHARASTSCRDCGSDGKFVLVAVREAL